MTKKSTEKDTDDKILARIDKRANDWFTYFSENNEQYRLDTNFLYAEDGQWTDEEINEYRLEGKPRLTFNMATRLILNLQGEFAGNMPALKVRATDSSEATQEQVDLAEGLTRKISLDSRNDIVYQTSFACALSGGYGAFRVKVVPESVVSFSYIPNYEIIQDPTTCFWDPSAIEPNKSDGDFSGCCHTISKDQFKEKYPDIEFPESYVLSDQGSNSFRWISENEIVIVEYYEKEYFKRHIALVSDGQSTPTVLDFDDAEDFIKRENKIINKINDMSGGMSNIPKMKIMQEKMVDDFKICFYVAIKDKIIERSDWDGKVLPIIFQPGSSRWVDGREKTISFVHWLKDAQRSYNYSRSEFIYRLKLSRHEPYLVSEKNIEGHIKEWKDAYKAKSALIFKTDPSGFSPQRQSPQEVPQSLSASLSQSLVEMQSISGRYDANSGAQGNEMSGVAIQSRQAPGNMNSFQFFENARLAIETGARVVTDLIPKLVDTERSISIQQENGSIVQKKVNGQDGLSVSKDPMNVSVTVGASFELQQKAAVDQLLSLVTALPQLAPLIPDLVVENLDIKNAPQLVQRIKDNALDPMIVATESGDEQKIQQAQQQKSQQAQLVQAQSQLQLLLEKTAAQGEQIRALAAERTSQANMMNAETNRLEAESKGAVESQKAQSEENKANLSLLTQVVKTVGESNKIKPYQVF